MAGVAIDVENKNPKELLGLGIRAYILQDYSSAVEALGKASELLATEHGDDLHDSLAEIYFYYGKALLGLAREEAQALGDAVPRSATDDSDSDGEEGNDLPENEANSNENHTFDLEEAVNGTLKEKSTDAGPSTSSDGIEESGLELDNEEPTDLQVAWEVLELAKKIYKRNEDVNKKYLADTLITLGEVSLESENFDSAISDIKEGLEIQKTLFGNDSRAIAETYYNLGIAYATSSHIDEAVESFKSSLEYLKNRIEVLGNRSHMKEEAKDEIREIRELIPDIEEKINDMKSYKEETIKNITDAVNGTPTGSSSSSKQISDISHLVKRKRKIDEIESTCSTDSPAIKRVT